MLLSFRDAAHLRTKKIIFEEVFRAYDASTLEQLRDLSSWRRSIETSINSFTSKEILQKLEQYLPLLQSLTEQMRKVENSSLLPDVKIQWTSSLSSGSCIKNRGREFFSFSNLAFELGMSIFLYGAILRERAFEALSYDLTEAATMFRKASGVYEYLATGVLASAQSSLPKERPVELNPNLSYIMSRLCLADAQATTAKRAEEKKVSALLLSKLHYGVAQLLGEANSAIESSLREGVKISSRLQDFVSTCRALHELRSQVHLAEELRSTEQVGSAVSIVCNAMSKIKKLKSAKNKSHQLVLNKEMQQVAEKLKRMQHEHEFLWNRKTNGAHLLLVLEEKIIVSAIPFEPHKLAKVFMFQI
ncbi:hypothetical protein HPP92_023813 [Vanilla planifolia]|uniref:BRO1 domain-containing protein n=1 Tax=Vanilla planifolia TaxID=51239 RepID=A0A835PIJ8_VANPL|nr:hypothetical protein HPP92_023813 [Vanilla planifolia]